MLGRNLLTSKQIRHTLNRVGVGSHYHLRFGVRLCN